MVKGSKTSVKINGLRVSVGSWLPTAAWECGRPGNGITDACGGSEGHWNCKDAGRSTGWRLQSDPRGLRPRSVRIGMAPHSTPDHDLWLARACAARVTVIAAA